MAGGGRLGRLRQDWLSFSRIGTASLSTACSAGVRSLQPAGQPRLAQLTYLAYHVAALDGHGEYDLPAVAWMRHPLNQAAFFQRSDDPGDRGRLHLLVLGELAWRHRALLERRQGGEL